MTTTDGKSGVGATDMKLTSSGLAETGTDALTELLAWVLDQSSHAQSNAYEADKKGATYAFSAWNNQSNAYQMVAGRIRSMIDTRARPTS